MQKLVLKAEAEMPKYCRCSSYSPKKKDVSWSGWLHFYGEIIYSATERMEFKVLIQQSTLSMWVIPLKSNLNLSMCLSILLECSLNCLLNPREGILGGQNLESGGINWVNIPQLLNFASSYGPDPTPVKWHGILPLSWMWVGFDPMCPWAGSGAPY